MSLSQKQNCTWGSKKKRNKINTRNKIDVFLFGYKRHKNRFMKFKRLCSLRERKKISRINSTYESERKRERKWAHKCLITCSTEMIY